jgi:thiopeptide-type bacteriocin biosynthesis protein
VLFFKVYGTHEALHEALCERIAPFLNEQLAKRSLRNWFYLPFSDPHPHLRIRLFGDPSYLTSLLGEFHEGLEDFFERRELWKLSIDTYDRETNRYGGAETLAICEEIFGLSSRESLAGYSNFHECGDSESAAIRALAASQERFLASVSDSIEEALDLAKFAFSRFNRETREEVLRAESEMSALFREERKEGVSPFSDASAEIREKISHLRSVCSTPNLKEIIADLLHVHSIRVCTTWPHCVGAEARGYLYLERRLAMLVALKRKGMR